jgi:hypothetical protein
VSAPNLKGKIMKVYATEPFFHEGSVVMPGDFVDTNADDVASILSSGRGTLDAPTATAAAKQYAAAAKAQAAPAGATV